MVISSFFALLSNILFFTSYVNDKNSFPKQLTPEQEREYIEKIRGGDEVAKEQLIRHNMRLVVHIAKKYMNYPDIDELISVGAIGLIKAVNTFTANKGTSIATYAARCIENEILMVIRSNKKHKNNRSLYESVGVDKEGNEINLIDLLGTENNSVITEVENKIANERLNQIVKESLGEREYRIIKLRYGLENCESLTQREVASKFGISRSYISRIEKKALQKIKLNIKKEDLYF